MAPRQRNVSASTTPATSEDEASNSSDDASPKPLLNDEKTKPSMKTKKSTEATVPSQITEADIARDYHDYFNIVALAVVVYACSLNYQFPSFSYTGNHFLTMWAVTLVYFFLDLLWVTVVPICVNSPGVIVKHHIVAMVYLSAPIKYPEYRWLMGAILSVEINTWFLICRRLVYRHNYCPSGYSKLPSVITTTVSTFFYITWVAIRCYLYPHILVLFFQMWKEAVQIRQTYFFWELLFIPVHIILCVLNLKWTYDLFKPIVNRWLGSGPKQVAVSSGL